MRNKRIRKIGAFFWHVKITSVLYFFLMHFRTKVIGGKNKKAVKGKCIIIANHKSIYDFTFLSYHLFSKSIYFLTNAHLFYISKFMGWFLPRIGCIPIATDDFDVNSYDSIIDFLNTDKTVVCFPEGQRNYTDEILPFKTGAAYLAFASKAPIIPVYIKSEKRLFGKNVIAWGEPIDVCGLASETLTPEDLTSISELLRQKVLELATLEMPFSQ